MSTAAVLRNFKLGTIGNLEFQEHFIIRGAGQIEWRKYFLAKMPPALQR